MAKRISRDHIDQLHDYKLYIPARTIYMSSELVDMDSESGVDSSMVERFLKNLLILESTSTEPITVILNNIGGDVYHGLAIYDAIKCCKSKIIMKVFGHAMSMGSVILQAASKRSMSPNAKQMIHYGTSYMAGHAKTVQKQAQEESKLDKWMERMYLERIREKNPDYTLEQLKELLNHDTYLTAKESVAMGLADEILLERK
jgi:ATP-dependent Clp endopeptidase proteolytic subunit ClpP